jgi:hypothetical protein
MSFRKRWKGGTLCFVSVSCRGGSCTLPRQPTNGSRTLAGKTSALRKKKTIAKTQTLGPLTDWWLEEYNLIGLDGTM